MCQLRSLNRLLDQPKAIVDRVATKYSIAEISETLQICQFCSPEPCQASSPAESLTANDHSILQCVEAGACAYQLSQGLDRRQGVHAIELTCTAHKYDFQRTLPAPLRGLRLL